MADSLAILGPTASGKTAVAIEVARRLRGEIISLDSRQVYRGMDIGTAKPSAAERSIVPHHGFDLVDPDDRFNAGRFARYARDVVPQIRARGHLPVLTGGTGFFLRAMLQPMFEEPALDAELKERWKGHLAAMSQESLRRWARALDPVGAAQVTDRQRLARIIEIAVLTGRPLTWWHRSAAAPGPAIDPRVFVLDLPREVLRQRIEARTRAMIEQGLVAEVQALLDRGFDEHTPGLNATGYVELIPYLRGECALEDAVSLIATATRQYARRQMTWLRHQLPPHAVWVRADRSTREVADEIVQGWGRELE